MDIRSNNTPLPGKKGDYWYVDRKRDYWYVDCKVGTRILMLALAIGITLLGAACSSTGEQMFQPETADVTRGTSDLCGTLLGTVDSTLTTVTSTTTSSNKWYIDCKTVYDRNGACPNKWYFDGATLNVGSSQAFDKVNVYFTDGSKTSLDVRTSSLSYKLPRGKFLDGFMLAPRKRLSNASAAARLLQ